MSIVYVTTPGSTVRRRGDLLQVWRGKSKTGDIKLGGLDRLVLIGPVQLTSQAAALLMDRGTDVAFLTGGGRYRGALMAAESRNVYLRLAQFDRWKDGAFRLAAAREIVRSKVAAQRRLMQRQRRDHPELIEAEAIEQLERLLAKVDEAEALEVVRGLEGAASSTYWRQFGRMLRELPFPGRKMHPSTDPVNALLSLGYVILTNELGGLLEAAGLDPFIGLLHGIRYGRRSLPLDAVEVFRQPVVDRLTLRLFNRRQIKVDDFEGGKGGLRLQPEALKRYLEWHDEQMRSASEGEGSRSWREVLRDEAGLWRKQVLDGEVTPHYTWPG